jgi:hypothetical protein
MAEYLRLARLYLLLLAIVTIGRWTLGFQHVPYEKATDKMSIVILTLFSSIFYGAFGRRWLNFRIGQALAMGALMGLLSQIVILLSTVASYSLGIDSYFTNPLALDPRLAPAAIPFGQAVGIRIFGMVVNILLTAIAGAVGWAMGALLPHR